MWWQMLCDFVQGECMIGQFVQLYGMFLVVVLKYVKMLECVGLLWCEICWCSYVCYLQVVLLVVVYVEIGVYECFWIGVFDWLDQLLCDEDSIFEIFLKYGDMV